MFGIPSGPPGSYLTLSLRNLGRAHRLLYHIPILTKFFQVWHILNKFIDHPVYSCKYDNHGYSHNRVWTSQWSLFCFNEWGSLDFAIPDWLVHPTPQTKSVDLLCTLNWCIKKHYMLTLFVVGPSLRVTLLSVSDFAYPKLYPPWLAF